MITRFLIGAIIVLLSLQLSPALAQWEEEEEEPIPPPRRYNVAKIGGAVGFTPVLLFWNVDAVNEYVFPALGKKFDKSPMILWGGGGYAYIMLIENMRVGGMGLSGSSKLSVLSGSTRRDVEVSIGYGGVSLEYAIPIIERVDVVPGIVLGGGSMGIKMTRDEGGFKRWHNLWNDFGDTTRIFDFSRNLEGSFFTYQPSLHVEVAILQWLGLRAGISYVGMAAPDWKLDEQFEIADVPSKVNGKGWVFNTGIFVGTFLF